MIQSNQLHIPKFLVNYLLAEPLKYYQDLIS